MQGHKNKIEKYTLLELIAKGGMGEVHLARSSNASGVLNFVAIKSVLSEFTRDQFAADRFREEAAIGMKLKHPNIVTIFEFGKDLNQFFVVMEFIRGQTLRTVVKNLHATNMLLPIPVVVHIAKAAASALDYARRCIDPSSGLPLNLVHKDISPQNIMVGYEGDIKIIDFGIAKASQAESSELIEGKLAYMSPEQASGDPIDHRSDLYALGLVVFEMLTGTPLFNRIERQKIKTITELETFTKQSIASLPDLVRPIVAKLLEVKPDQRYQTGNKLFLDLGNIDFDVTEVQPETGLVDLMNGLFADEISLLNKKFIRFSNSPKTENERTSLSEIKNDTKSKILVDADRTFVTNSSSQYPVNHTKSSLQPTQLSGFKPPFSSELTAKTFGNQIQVHSSPNGPIMPNSVLPTTNVKVKNSLIKTASTGLVNSGFSIFTSVIRSLVIFLIGTYAIARYNGFDYIDYLKLTRNRLSEVNSRIIESYQNDKGKVSTEASTLGATQTQSIDHRSTASIAPASLPSKQPMPQLGQQTTTEVVQDERLVRITSLPANAVIYVNGKSTGLATPHFVSIPSAQIAKLTLKKDGYRDFEASVKPEDNAEFHANLNSLTNQK